MRDEVDVDRLTGEMVGVVEHTMPPASVSLWLREAGYSPSALGTGPPRLGSPNARNLPGI